MIESQANGYQADLEADLPFLSATATEIAANIASRKPGWTAVRVLSVYVRSATRAQERTNCLTEVLFVQAFERAKGLDKHLAETGRTVGPRECMPQWRRGATSKSDWSHRGLQCTVFRSRSRISSTMKVLIVQSGSLTKLASLRPLTQLWCLSCSRLARFRL